MNEKKLKISMFLQENYLEFTKDNLRNLIKYSYDQKNLEEADRITELERQLKQAQRKEPETDFGNMMLGAGALGLLGAGAYYLGHDNPDEALTSSGGQGSEHHSDGNSEDESGSNVKKIVKNEIEKMNDDKTRKTAEIIKSNDIINKALKDNDIFDPKHQNDNAYLWNNKDVLTDKYKHIKHAYNSTYLNTNPDGFNPAQEYQKKLQLMQSSVYGKSEDYGQFDHDLGQFFQTDDKNNNIIGNVKDNVNWSKDGFKNLNDYAKNFGYFISDEYKTNPQDFLLDYKTTWDTQILPTIARAEELENVLNPEAKQHFIDQYNQNHPEAEVSSLKDIAIKESIEKNPKLKFYYNLGLDQSFLFFNDNDISNYFKSR